MKRKAEEERGLIRAPVFLVFVLCLLRQSGNGVLQQSGVWAQEVLRLCFGCVGPQVLPGF